MITKLEALRLAKASLSDLNQTYEFSEWTSCTCGHVYAPILRSAEHVLGGPDIGTLAMVGPRTMPMGLYAEVLEDVCRANPDLASYAAINGASNLADVVSDMTVYLAGGRPPDQLSDPIADPVLREAALALVSSTIEMIERDQEAARLAVVATSDASGLAREVPVAAGAPIHA